MADLTKDSFNETNKFAKILFQRGKDLLDFELNEMQDIMRVFLFRQMLAGTQNTFLNPGANDNGYKVVGTGASNQATVQAGTVFCDGIPLHNTANFTLTGFTTPGSDRTDTVYLEVTETEVVDPAQVPQLGETSKRRQLQVTPRISETGDAGVPANTGLEIWQGGIHYFIVARIARHAGSAVIASGDVTDARFLLPPSIMSQITRQSNFQVQSLTGSIFETGNGTALPRSRYQYFETDPDNFYTGQQRGWYWGVARDTGSATTPMSLLYGGLSFVNMTGFTSLTGELLLSAGTAIAGAGAIEFSDANTRTSPGTGTNVVALTDASAAGRRIHTYEISPTNVATSIVKAVNARYYVSCGDGTNTFGDFNGAGALQNALSFTDTPGPGQNTFVAMLKPGTYTGAGAYSLGQYTASASWKISGTTAPGALTGSPNVGATVTAPAFSTYTDAAISAVGNQVALEVENVVFVGSATGTVSRAFHQDGGYDSTFLFRNCVFVDCDVYFGDPARVVFENCAFVTGSNHVRRTPCVTISADGTQTDPTRGEIIARNCVFFGSYSDNPIFRMRADAALPFEEYFSFHFADCRFYLGGSSLSGGNMVGNTAIFDFVPNGTADFLFVRDITVENCEAVVGHYTAAAGAVSVAWYTHGETAHNVNPGGAEFGHLENITLRNIKIRRMLDSTVNPVTAVSSYYGINIVLDNVYIDMNDTVGGGPTAAGVRYLDSSAAMTTADWGAVTLSNRTGMVSVRNLTINNTAALSSSGDLTVMAPTSYGSVHVEGVRLLRSSTGAGSAPNQRIYITRGNTTNPAGGVVMRDVRCENSDVAAAHLGRAVVGISSNFAPTAPCILDNIRVIGSGAASDAGAGITINCSDSTTSNVIVRNSYVSGCGSGYALNAGVATSAVYSDVVIDTCKAISCYYGLYAGSDAVVFDNVSVVSSSFKSCTLQGVYVTSSKLAPFDAGITSHGGFRMVGCNVELNNRGVGGTDITIVQATFKHTKTTASPENPLIILSSNTFGAGGFGVLQVTAGNNSGPDLALATDVTHDNLITVGCVTGIQTATNPGHYRMVDGEMMVANAGFLKTP